MCSGGSVTMSYCRLSLSSCEGDGGALASIGGMGS